MQKKDFLVILAFVLAASILATSSVFSAEYHGSLSVDVGEAGIIIGPEGEFCGDNDLQAYRGEQCDGGDLGGKSCVSLGYDSGTLDCKSNCVYDTSDCETTSGNGNGGGDGDTGGGSSSGSSGSSGGSGRCIEDWQCTAWSSCADGKQRRTCTDAEKCGTVKIKPTTLRTCSVEMAGAGEEEEITLTTSTSEEERGFLGGITGAVIGTLGTAGTIGVLIFIIAIVAILIFVIVMKKKEGEK